jgi:C4-dicarboxylate transporter DctQ subunit
LDKLERFAKKWSELFNWIAVAGIAAMLGITVTDIVCTKIFRRPLLGSMDIISLLGLLAAAFAIAQTEILKQHVRIDVFTVLLKERTRSVLGVVSSFFALMFAALLIWRSVDYGFSLETSKLSSATLRILFFPFSYLIALACIPLFLILFLELFEFIRKAAKR